MADATTAARARIDRALAELERKILELKARPASAPAIADDDLFAPRSSGQGADGQRVAEDSIQSYRPPPQREHTGFDAAALQQVVDQRLQAEQAKVGRFKQLANVVG